MDEFGFVGAFLVGLLGGVHCVGMCGGIVGAVSLAPQATVRRSFWPVQLGYNAGRITSYTIAGAIMGGVGVYFSAFLPVMATQRALLALAGVFMLLLGFYLAGWWALLARLEKAGALLWRRIEPLGRRFLPAGGFRQAFGLGLVWGWLPCGLVYSTLIWTLSAGGTLEGGMLMLSFGLGTLPNLLLMGAAAHWLQSFVRRPLVRQVAGGLIAAYGIWLLVDAMGR